MNCRLADEGGVCYRASGGRVCESRSNIDSGLCGRYNLGRQNFGCGFRGRNNIGRCCDSTSGRHCGVYRSRSSSIDSVGDGDRTRRFINSRLFRFGRIDFRSTNFSSPLNAS